MTLPPQPTPDQPEAPNSADGLGLVSDDGGAMHVIEPDLHLTSGEELAPLNEDTSTLAKAFGHSAEMLGYLVLQASWFAGFGLQMVLFPYVTSHLLTGSERMLGIAQMTLTLPSLFLLVIGGAIAERSDGRKLLALLHVAAAIPPIIIGLAVNRSLGPNPDPLQFWMIPAFGLAMGTIGAFMMPTRDAMLASIIHRRNANGRGPTMQQGIAVASLVQFAGQILGLELGGMAGDWGAGWLFIAQGAVMGLGAVATLFLAASPRSARAAARAQKPLAAIGEGLMAVRRSPILMAMVLQMATTGVCVIGAFLVILPLVSRDVYAGGAGALRDVFVTFWVGAFISSAALTRIPTAHRPGRWLLIAQGFGTLAALGLVFSPPYAVFMACVFVWGLAGGVSITLSRTVLQLATPAHLMARVMSIFQLGFMGGAPIGALIYGDLAERFGLTVTMMVPPISLAALIGVSIWLSPIWRLTRDDLDPSRVGSAAET